jgi:hypothetical protein
VIISRIIICGLPGSAVFFHIMSQTDKTKLIVAFRNFANAPKKLAHYSKVIIDNKARKNNITT